MDKHSGSNSGIGFLRPAEYSLYRLKVDWFYSLVMALGAVTTLDQPCHLDRAGSDRYRN